MTRSSTARSSPGRSACTRAGSRSSSAPRPGSPWPPRAAPTSRSSRRRWGSSSRGCVAWEPAFGQDLEWALLMRSVALGRPDGSSAYFRLTTRPLDQSLARVPEDRGGARAPARATYSPAVTCCGAADGRARRSRSSASGALDARGAAPRPTTCRTAGYRRRRRLPDLGRSGLPGAAGPAGARRRRRRDPGALLPADRAAPIVTVLDGHPHTLSFLSASARRADRLPGRVDDFGQSGDVDDLYRYFGIDTDTIVGAAIDLTAMTEITDAQPVRLDGGGHDPHLAQGRRRAAWRRGEELVEIETDKATMTYESPRGASSRSWPRREPRVAVGRADRPARQGRRGTRSDAGAGSEGSEDEPAASPGPSHATHAAELTVADEPVPVGAAAARRWPTVQRRSLARATPLARRARPALTASTWPPARAPARAAGSRASTSSSQRARASSRRPATRAARRRTDAPSADDEPDPGRRGQGPVTVVEPTRLQQVIARRMAEAKATIPHSRSRPRWRSMPPSRCARSSRTQAERAGPSLVQRSDRQGVRARAARAPARQRLLSRRRLRALRRVNIGIAVAAPTTRWSCPRSSTPTRSSLGAIAAEARRLAAARPRRQVTPPELSGATFTVSNLGMYGMSAITPVINPPQAAILGVGAARALPASSPGS